MFRQASANRTSFVFSLAPLAAANPPLCPALQGTGGAARRQFGHDEIRRGRMKEVEPAKHGPAMIFQCHAQYPLRTVPDPMIFALGMAPPPLGQTDAKIANCFQTPLSSGQKAQVGTRPDLLDQTSGGHLMVWSMGLMVWRPKHSRVVRAAVRSIA